MKLISIVGARPQFIKAAVVSRAIANYNQNHSDPSTRINEIILHTGQHYDPNMSQIFFDELQIPEPNYNLGVGSSRHGKMTGMMLEKIETVSINEKPDCVLVYGDTNTTLAGALAAAKLHLPLGHVEAGLRSYNRQMPEEINRVLTDHVSNFLFCPTQTAVDNLEKESITEGVYLIGDVMYDAFLFYKDLSDNKSQILQHLKLTPKNYCLATIHRAENADDPKKLENIFTAFGKLASNTRPFVVPIHPRTRNQLEKLNIISGVNKYVYMIEPVSYLDMVALEKNAEAIFTDSGGVQKEAYFAEVPCLTLRNETEWIETVTDGWNQVVGTSKNKIIKGYRRSIKGDMVKTGSHFGTGNTGENVVKILMSELNY